MILPFVREIFAELEQSSAFDRVRRHLNLGTGRRRVSGLTNTARSLYLPLFARAAKSTCASLIVADNKAAEALELTFCGPAANSPEPSIRAAWCGFPLTMCCRSRIFRRTPMCRSSARRLCGNWPQGQCPS